jgi:hypothetical protein
MGIKRLLSDTICCMHSRGKLNGNQKVALVAFLNVETTKHTIIYDFKSTLIEPMILVQSKMEVQQELLLSLF